MHKVLNFYRERKANINHGDKDFILVFQSAVIDI